MDVLILDDEFFIRENIRNGIDWASLDIEHVMACDNGNEAIEICRNQTISIMISDIRMPGLNGIESIRQIRRFCPDIKIIFISGYPEKEYLKDAIRLQAVNFIEKSIDMRELYQILQELVSDMKERQEAEARMEIASGLQLRYYKIRLAQELTASGSDYQKLLPMAIETGFLQDSYSYITLVASFSSNFYDTMEQEFTDHIYEACEAYIDPSFQIIAGFRNHYLLMHFSGNFSNNSLYYQKKLRYVLQTVILDALTARKVTVRIGISAAVSSLYDLKAAYAQACVAYQQAFYLTEGSWYFYRDLVSQTYAFTPAIISEFQGYLLDSRPDCFLKRLNEVYLELHSCSNTLLNPVYHFYCQLAEVLWNWCRQHNHTCFYDITDKYQMLDVLQKLLYLRDLHGFFQYRLEKIIVQIDTWHYGNETVNAIARYISLHYQNPDLSIQEISDEIHMAPNYIANLFKKHTCTTINNYVTEHRIAIAKNMLVHSEKPITDIAIETGFRNAGYFSRVFFKYTHLTPSEYRRRRS